MLTRAAEAPVSRDTIATRPVSGEPGLDYQPADPDYRTTLELLGMELDLVRGGGVVFGEAVTSQSFHQLR